MQSVIKQSGSTADAMMRVYAQMQLDRANKQNLQLHFASRELTEKAQQIVPQLLSFDTNSNRSSSFSVAKLKQNSDRYISHLKSLEQQQHQITIFATLSQQARQMWQNLLRSTTRQANKATAELANEEASKTSDFTPGNFFSALG